MHYDITPPLHYLTYTHLYLGSEQAFNLPVTSVTTPAAAGTSPIAELTGWIIQELFIYFSEELST